MSVITQSKEIKKLILKRLEDDNISSVMLCRLLDIDIEHFLNGYLLTNGRTYGMTEKKLFKITDKLGIKIKMVAILLNSDNYDGKKLKQEINDYAQEKRATSRDKQDNIPPHESVWGRGKVRVKRQL